MFSFPNKRRPGFITVHPALRRAADLARAFILLEDLEPSAPRTLVDEHPHHPHRVPLRLMGGTRRPGAGVPREQRCLSPVTSRSPVTREVRPWKRAGGPVGVAACAGTHVSH
jgi:hypothetical protein